MAAEKLCVEQNPEMWELAQDTHCPFCQTKNETKGSTGSWLKIWLPKVINKMFNGMSFSNKNVLILHKKDMLILTYSELCIVAASFLIEMKN